MFAHKWRSSRKHYVSSQIEALGAFGSSRPEIEAFDTTILSNPFNQGLIPFPNQYYRILSIVFQTACQY